MATTLFLQRSLNSLKPVDAHGEEMLRGLPKGKHLKAVITQPRNVQHHRKFFALLNAIHPHQDTYPTIDSLLCAMKCALGYGETVELPDGRIVLVPGSISFAKMDQADFSNFYARAVALIETKILPGVDSADLKREVAEIMRGQHGIETDKEEAA